MVRRGNAVLPHRHPAGLRDLAAHFGGRQYAAVAGLGALAQFELDHLDLIVRGRLREFVGAEAAVGIAAAEITGADLPDDVAAHLAVIPAEPALPRVMREAAALGAAIERTDRVGAQRAEAHGGDVEHGRRIGLGTVGAADHDPERLDGMGPWRDRVAQPLVAVSINVVLRAEGPLVEDILRALIDDRALVAAERHPGLIVLEEILPHLRPDLFQQEPQMRRDRIVAQDRVPLLDEVHGAQERQAAGRQERDRQIWQQARLAQYQRDEKRGHEDRGRVDDEPRREG